MYDFVKNEHEILKFWQAKKIFEKLRKKNKDKKKWSFIDGPITANNSMGVHHAWGRTYKDLFHRFKAMQGHEIRYQNGFDCQGLWVEREEEKDLGLKNKDDIEKFGILKFVKACRKRVEKFSKIQTQQSIRLGYWMDWNNSYYTMSDNNQLHNWMLFKEYHKKGWLYKGKDAVPWCWRCGTANSKHDIATEGYKEVTHKALFMQFPLKNESNTYFLIFTTTPWTVPENVAIAVNENIDYALVENNGKKYWLAESRLWELKGKGNTRIIKKVKGSKLKGIEYQMPYSNLESQKDADPKSPHKVVLWNLASGEEGTGIVHIAPGCGAEDFSLGKEENLPAISPLNEAGIFQKGFGQFSGKKYSEVNTLVLQDLEKREFVYKIENIKHRYPHCWRCGEELVFRLVDEWYIKCNEIRNKLIQKNKKITWYPHYGKIRQEDWFKNMSDWLISRKRYWGLALPIWECESCNWFEVIGSLKELKEKAIKEDKKKVSKLPEIHRPWVDEIKISCKKCGKQVSRIKDVGDAWLDAGIVPLSTLKYLTNKSYWKKWFPADLISENMPGQYRGWFNALFWANTTIAGKAPFKALFGYETLKDEHGQEMHKSKGNAIWFDEAVEKVGADPMRLTYCLQDPSQELRFGYNVLKEPQNNLNILFNLSRLISNSSKKIKKPIKEIEDKWILSRLNNLILTVTTELEELHPHFAMRALKDFWLNDFSRSYVQIVRDRLSANDKTVEYVVKETYVTLLKLCSPFVPFITEKIWQELKKKKIVKEESVHSCSWPKANKKLMNNKLEPIFDNTLKIIEAGLAERDKLKLGLRWPLSRVIVFIKGRENFSEVKEIIARQLNVKEVIFESPASKGREFAIEFYTKLTPELEAEGFAREVSRQVQAFRKKLGLKKQNKIKLVIISSDDNLRKLLEMQKKFVAERTNSKKVEIVKSSKETFKKQTAFSVKDKRGMILIK